MNTPTSPAQSQQAGTVASILSGERTYQNVTYAITGQPQVDCLAGLFAVIGHYPLDAAVLFELLQMLANQYRRRAQTEADWQAKLNSGAAGLAQQSMSSGSYPKAFEPNMASSGGVSASDSKWPESLVDQLQGLAGDTPIWPNCDDGK